MRIVIIENSLGDLLSSRIGLGRYLEDREYEVFMYAKDAIKRVEQQYSTFRVGSFGVLKLFYEIIKIKPDVILSFRLESHLLTFIFHYILGFRVFYVVTGLGRYFDLENKPKGLKGFVINLFYKYVIARSCDPIIVQNSTDAAYFYDLNPKLNVKMIKGSGVDISSSVPLKECVEHKFYFAGRCLEEKGVKIAIDSIIEWNSRNPSRRVSLDIYGFHKEDYLKTIDSKYVDNEFVSFLGWQNLTNDKVMKYCALINPTKYREGIPRVVLQAYSSGVPAILSRVPGNDEMIIEELGLDFTLDSTKEILFCISNALNLDRDKTSKKCIMKLKKERAFAEDVYMSFEELLK